MIKEATKRPRRSRNRLGDEATKGGSRGFTLLEMVVVISLVLFLLGLTLAVGVNVIERSEISRTRNTIRLLDMALREWEAAADRKLTWGRDEFAPDGSPSPVAVYDENYIRRRSRLIMYAIDARRQRFPVEKPYVYKPFAGQEDRYVWTPDVTADLKDYNLQDIGI